MTSLSGILLKRVAELCLIISSLINCNFTYLKHFSEGITNKHKRGLRELQLPKEEVLTIEFFIR